MKFITFQKPGLNYLFYIAYFSTVFFREYINDEIKIKKTKSGYFFRMYVSFLSHFISVIPFFISKYLSKNRTKNKENKTETNTIEYIHIDIFRKDKGRNLIKNTLLTSLFSFLAELLLYTFYFVIDKTEILNLHYLNIYIIFQCLLIYIISYFILKTHFYKHYYLSLFINFIGFSTDFIIDIIKIVQAEIIEYKYYIYITIRLTRLILLCYHDCYAKLAMYEAFLSPYSLMVYKAIYENLFLIIYTIPFIFIPAEEFDGTKEIIYKGFLNYLSGIKILYSILMLINNYLCNLSIMYIIDKFSPNHFTLAMILGAFIDNIRKIIKNGKETDWIIYVNFGLLFVIFIASMIHNEIIIINKWGLNKKTKFFLNNEFNEEKNDILNINQEDILLEADEDEKSEKKDEQKEYE